MTLAKTEIINIIIIDCNFISVELCLSCFVLEVGFDIAKPHCKAIAFYKHNFFLYGKNSKLF